MSLHEVITSDLVTANESTATLVAAEFNFVKWLCCHPNKLLIFFLL